MTSLHRLLIASSALAALPAAAQVQWYAVAAGGSARTDIEQVRSVEGGIRNAITMQTAFDDSDAAWKLSAGLRFNAVLALEMTYADLGRTMTHTRGVGSDFALPYGFTVDRTVRGLGLDVVGTLPVVPSRLDLIGKLGVYRTSIRADVALEDNAAFSSAPESRFRRDTGKEDIAHLGVGLQARITPRWAIRAEYERFLSVGNPFTLGDPNGTGRSDMDVAWLGVVYRF
jgi:opacity protein-like surface antigen